MNRQDLKDYKYNKKWIQERIEEIVERKANINRLTSIYGEGSKGTSPIQDKIAEGLVKILDETNEYEKILYDLKEKQIKIENELDKLEPFYRNILYDVYIKGKTLMKVADEINYSYEETCRKHGIALKKFDNLQ